MFLAASSQVREGLKVFSNWPTYPQLYVNGTLVGGLDIIKELRDEGELKDTLNAAAPEPAAPAPVVSLDDRLRTLIKCVDLA